MTFKNFNSTLDPKISISREEIQHHIKWLSKEKAPCPDIFTNERIISCGDKIVDELWILFNSILRHAHDPEMFNVGKVISVFKGKAKIKVIVKIIEI